MRGSRQSQFRIQQPLSRHLFLCQSTRQWQAIINARFSAKSRSPHLFTLRKKRHSSSSWAGKSPNFRREIRQSHYRNDPVKYDLNNALPFLPVQQNENQASNWWTKFWTIQQDDASWLICHMKVWTPAHLLVTPPLSKVNHVQNSAPSMGGGVSFSPHVRTTWASGPRAVHFIKVTIANNIKLDLLGHGVYNKDMLPTQPLEANLGKFVLWPHGLEVPTCRSSHVL